MGRYMGMDLRAWPHPLRGRKSLSVALPILASAVRAGFPSPAEDYVEGGLDLNEHLIRHPAATFIVRVEGDSMIGAGIFPGDLLVVDRSIEPHDGHVVIAAVAGELTVKRLKGGPKNWRLVAEHPGYPTLTLGGDGESSSIWGVVAHSIRRLSP
jgi:DNA polymerase V